MRPEPLDYPTAWRIQREMVGLVHDKRCSSTWPEDGGPALGGPHWLCDCGAVEAAWDEGRWEAQPKCDGRCMAASDFIDCAPDLIAYPDPECSLHVRCLRGAPSERRGHRMTTPTAGRVEHRTTVTTYDDANVTWAMWKCSCGDWMSGYLKAQYAEDDAHHHVSASTPTARREEHDG